MGISDLYDLEVYTYKSLERVLKGGIWQTEKLRLLQVSLTFQGLAKVNISDNNVECSTPRIVYITISNMNFCQIQEYGTYF
jgi:hypothetical protein